MDIKLTQKLFSTLIQKPTLTDKLLERPPFKFLHDVITETINSTGYLKGYFTDDELDVEKASSSKEFKLAFLQKLIDILNIDGLLNQVKPAKIVAGKESENTNFLLQKFASEAASHLLAIKTNNINEKKASKNESSKKHNSKLSKTLNKTNKEKVITNDNVENVSTKLSKNTNDLKKLTITEKTKKKSTKSLKLNNELQANIIDEGVSSPHNLMPIAQKELDSVKPLPERELSGGTSKGGDDSGIAEAESERNDSEKLKNRNFLNNLNSITSTSKLKQDSVLIRPTTGIGIRPQTSIGRLGTAIARAAPPKLKKTKIADINVLEVSAQPVATNTALIMENDQIFKNNDVDEFLVEEDDEFMPRGSDISSLNDDAEHGILVNKIIKNTKELEKDNLFSTTYSDSTIDFHEQRRMKHEIENVQNSLQITTQNMQPLARTLDYITNDFDSILKEIEQNRKIALKSKQKIESYFNNSADSLFSLTAKLRNLENDIRETQKQIANAITNVISNDKMIETQLCGE